MAGYVTCEVVVVESEVNEVGKAPKFWWYGHFEAIEAEVKIDQSLQHRDASRDGSMEAIATEVELSELRKCGEV